ncbi:hypothetical protein CNMCM7691_006404 [Aspergillus felis]|uniref:Uncharacterized protein n=1 Tax=Aspergillus felis TaxID=1287682 RepID=A0A8H6R552_9EURO|nr:hypothetical protein CNMCM7691_006404 [Aspergillus felis]
MNILSYRHAAITISWVHLKCGGFKQDYRADDAAFNKQASHRSWIAGTVYARGLQEAPGYIEARRRQYRAISREWHGFLGFETYLGPRKRPAQDDLRQTHRGRVGPKEKARGEAELQQSFQYVLWQQVFPSGPGSHYIHIRYPEGQLPAPSTDYIQAAVDEVVQAWEQAQARAKADQAIQASQLTNANPWLRITRWADYLQGIQAHDLLACVAAPEEDPSP